MPRTERQCMKCHRFLCLGYWGFGENFLYWGFVLAFCNGCFTPNNFRIWCKGKSETAVYHATRHIDEYLFLLVGNLNYCLCISCCNSGCMLYCVWSSFYISASKISRLTDKLRLHLLIELKNYIQTSMYTSIQVTKDCFQHVNTIQNDKHFIHMLMLAFPTVSALGRKCYQILISIFFTTICHRGEQWNMSKSSVHHIPTIYLSPTTPSF